VKNRYLWCFFSTYIAKTERVKGSQQLFNHISKYFYHFKWKDLVSFLPVGMKGLRAWIRAFISSISVKYLDARLHDIHCLEDLHSVALLLVALSMSLFF
jgi:hypothetical protein